METENETTLDSLARMIGKGFEGVHEEMAAGFAGVHAEITEVRNDLRNRPTHVDLERELQKYRYAKEIDEIGDRVKVCEDKLGIAR